MIYIEKVNNIIIGRFSGDSVPAGDRYEADPLGVAVVGANRSLWDSAWSPRPLADLVADGLASPPWGYRWDGTTFVEMSTAEKVAAGVLEVGDLEVLDGNEIRAKTPLELGRDHLIDLEVLKSILIAQASSLHLTLLDRGFQYEGVQYSGKDTLQQRATSILTAVVAGIPPAFPMGWPNAQDETVSFASLDAFRAFAGALMSFVQATDKSVGDIKTAIRAATDTAVAAQLYSDWEAQA